MRCWGCWGATRAKSGRGHMWTYDQLSGALGKDGQRVATGYSGFGQGKNNPDMENVPDVGPIPRGVYDIGPPHDTTTHGPHVMALTPEPGTNTLGRDGFLSPGFCTESPWIRNPSRRSPVPTLLAATDS